MLEAIIEHLRADHASPQPWTSSSGAWRYTRRTYARTFHSVIADVGPAVVQFTAADSFSDDLAVMLLARARAFAAGDWPEAGGYRIGTLAAAETSFHAIVLDGPKPIFPTARELVVSSGYPIHRCELAADERSSDMYEVRRRCVDMIDWQRTPQPRVRFRYAAASGAGADHFLFAPLDQVLAVFSMLTADDDWIEIENFERVVLKFVKYGPGLKLQQAKDPGMVLPQAALHSGVSDFCLGRPSFELQLTKAP